MADLFFFCCLVSKTQNLDCLKQSGPKELQHWARIARLKRLLAVYVVKEKPATNSPQSRDLKFVI